MCYIMKCCIILHEMIFESRGDNYSSGFSQLQHYADAVAMFNGGLQFKRKLLSAT